MAHHQRISGFNKIALVGVAGLFDLVGLILDIFHLIPGLGTVIIILLNSILSFVSFLVFGLWFYLLGVGFLRRPKNMAVGIGSVLLELIPVGLPALTAG